MAVTLLFIPRNSDEYRRLSANPSKAWQLCDQSPECPGERGAELSPQLALEWANREQPALILIGDLRCAAALSVLREAGWRAERIGHRRFGGDLGPDDVDLSPGLTTREQIAVTCGVPLSPEDQEREAWQRDGWAGLSAMGLAWDKADRFVGQALGEREWAKAREDAKRNLSRELDDLILALAPRRRPDDTDITADALQSPPKPRDQYPAGTSAEEPCPADRDPRDYRQAAHRCEPVEVKPVLVLNHEEDQADLKGVSRVEYRGPRSHETWLRRLLEAPDLNHAFDLTLEVGRHRCRLVASLAHSPGEHQIDALVSRLLSVALVTGRPLRHFGCTFYLPLDLHLDRELNRLPSASDPSGACPGAPGRLAAALGQKAESHAICTPKSAVAILSNTISKAADNGDQRCKTARGELPEEAEEAQALLYFLPALQQRIFETGDSEPDDTIRHWRLASEHRLDLKLQSGPAAGDPRTHARIEDVSIYGHRNDLFILAIRVGMTDEQETSAKRLRGDHPAWWRTLFGPLAQFEGIAALQAERWLWFTKAARLLRPAFPQQELEGKIGWVSLSDPLCATFDHTHAFSPIALTLFNRLTGENLLESSERLRQVRDDRMVANVAYGLAGPSPGDDPFARAAFERLFSLGLFVDRGSDGFASQGGYAYDQGFVRGQMQDLVNRRWAGIGTLYGYTGHANCAMGFGDPFCGPIARNHVPYIYGRMLLLALFYKLTLTHFDRCIGQATLDLVERGDLGKIDTETFNRLYGNFIRFTNHQWFREVTSQTQGAETFRLQTRALGLEDQYALVKDKLERSDAFIEQSRGRQQMQESIRLSKRATKLTCAAVVAGLAALWLAWVAPVVAVLQMFSPDAKNIEFGVGLVVISTVIFLIALWLIYRSIKQLLRKNTASLTKNGGAQP